MISLSPPPADLPRAARFPLYLPRPIAPDGLSAGFPSPAQDYEEEELDIARYMIDRPVSTFFFRVKGDSMKQAGILNGDFVTADRSRQPQDGSMVVAFINGERTVKFLHMRDGVNSLIAANPNYPPIVITDETQCEIWGVVISSGRRIVPK